MARFITVNKLIISLTYTAFIRLLITNTLRNHVGRANYMENVALLISNCLGFRMLVAWYKHGSHMYSKASNVLEYNYAVRVPSNVLEWYPMFSMFSKTKIMKKPILFVIFVSVW